MYKENEERLRYIHVVVFGPTIQRFQTMMIELHKLLCKKRAESKGANKMTENTVKYLHVCTCISLHCTCCNVAIVCM